MAIGATSQLKECRSYLLYYEDICIMFEEIASKLRSKGWDVRVDDTNSLVPSLTPIGAVLIITDEDDEEFKLVLRHNEPHALLFRPFSQTPIVYKVLTKENLTKALLKRLNA